MTPPRPADAAGDSSSRQGVPAPAVVAGQAAAAAAEVEAFLVAPPDPKAAAFFDIDNTLVRGAAVFHLAMGLAKRHFFTSSDAAGFIVDQVKFRMSGAENARDMADATELALSFVKGHEVAEVVQLGREIFDDRIVGKVYPQTVAVARGHLDAGQRVWLVSAAPMELATIIAKRLGLTGALGTVSETVNGVYTGHLVGRPLHGPAKAEAVRALAAREGLDLSRCSAYSDSSNDIPMLSLVGNPCAVNPDKKLRQHARDLGWRIEDYRTGRKAARIGVPTAAAAGAMTGVAIAAAAALRKRRTD